MRRFLSRVTCAAVVTASALLVSAAPSGATTNVCAKHGGIKYAGAAHGGGSVEIICMDGTTFTI